MLPTIDENQINEIEAKIAELKELIQQLMQLRNASARSRLQLAIVDHSVCLEILEAMDQVALQNDDV